MQWILTQCLRAPFEEPAPSPAFDIPSSVMTPLNVTAADVRTTLQKTEPYKDAGSDNMPGMSEDIFNMSLSQTAVHT